MLYGDILEEYFKVRRRKTWSYSFAKKPGSDWAVKSNTRIARSSAESHGSVLLFTIGAKAISRPCRLQEKIAGIIQANGLQLLSETTTAGNRTAEYLGFDLASRGCTREVLRRVLDQVKVAVADCGHEAGTLL